MVLQLQANSQNQLTAADVEVIVRRILGAELATLRTSMDTDKKEAYTSQVSYCFEMQESSIAYIRLHVL